MPEAANSAQTIAAQAVASSLEAAFGKIHAERMDGVPILNPRLKVEALGTCEWNGHWLTVLVTPWFINLMLLSQTEEQREVWSKRALGSRAAYLFPAGRFEFLMGEEGGLGRYQMCSLFSPMLEFEDHEAARIAGQAALEALFDGGLDEGAAKETKAASEDASPPANGPSPAIATREVSRRGLFMGKITPEDGPL